MNVCTHGPSRHLAATQHIVAVWAKRTFRRSRLQIRTYEHARWQEGAARMPEAMRRELQWGCYKACRRRAYPLPLREGGERSEPVRGLSLHSHSAPHRPRSAMASA
jgi:hypothetical protein